ncbi:hypothetical protein DNK77_09220 [Enterobacter cloacae complex sp.]|nr:hypothetical protein DNK77_09220 [Enterobacter cloacae complex sp.]RAY65585.1 hypothetical protein DP199_24650 [Enterobacter kobei]
MYPKGARPNRWQSLHMVCKYRDHHKPVYPLRRLATATERGHRAKMRFTKSFWDCLETVATSIAFKLSQYVFDAWNYTPL